MRCAEQQAGIACSPMMRSGLAILLFLLEKHYLGNEYVSGYGSSTATSDCSNRRCVCLQHQLHRYVTLMTVYILQACAGEGVVMMVCNAYSTFSAGEVTPLLFPRSMTVSSVVNWPLKQQEHTAEQKLAYLHPKRPQAGNSQGYSQFPSPQTGSTQVGVRILSPMYASTSSLLEKVVVIPPSAMQTQLKCMAKSWGHDLTMQCKPAHP